MVGEQIKKLVDNQQVMTRQQIAIEIGITENNLYGVYALILIGIAKKIFDNI